MDFERGRNAMTKLPRRHGAGKGGPEKEKCSPEEEKCPPGEEKCSSM